MTKAGDDAASWLAEQAKAMEQALAELVEVNSFTENVEGGRKVGAMLEELYAIEQDVRSIGPAPYFAKLTKGSDDDASKLETELEHADALWEDIEARGRKAFSRTG